jgi:hypothetical protein
MVKYKGFSAISVVAVIAVVAFLGIAAFLVIDGNNKATDYSSYDFSSIIAPDVHNGNIGDHVKGNPDAKVVIVEYADFQCPGCAYMNTQVNSAIEKSNGKLAVVYRNYVLSYHQNGTAAASAAEAAGIQGYWKPYADLLFKNQADWEYASASERTALFNQYFMEASNNKGDLEKFNSDLASKEVSQKISFDMAIGKRVEISGTPAFYVDGQLIDWGNKTGGSVTVNGKTINWESSLSGEQFQELLVNIAKLKD